MYWRTLPANEPIWDAGHDDGGSFRCRRGIVWFYLHEADAAVAYLRRRCRISRLTPNP